MTGTNAYSGGTTLNAGTLVLANPSGPALGSGPVNINGGTLDASQYVQSIGQLTVGSLGSLNLSLTNTLTTSSMATFGGTINVAATGTQNQGLYKLIGGYASQSGSFTPGNLPLDYRLNAASTELDLVHLAVAALSSTSSGLNVRPGPQTIGVQVSNMAPVQSDSAAYQLSAAGNGSRPQWADRDGCPEFVCSALGHLYRRRRVPTPLRSPAAIRRLCLGEYFDEQRDDYADRL